MATWNTEAFSITHAAILDGSTGLEEANGDIYGVREASISPDFGEYDNTGDDRIMSTWSWFNKAVITVVSGYMPMALIALITGATLSSSGSGNSQRFDLPLWEQRGSNTISRPLLLKMEAKDSAGVLRYLQFLFYKCTYKPISFDGPRYKDGLAVNYEATALMSSTDEAGNTLAYESVGRIMAIGQ